MLMYTMNKNTYLLFKTSLSPSNENQYTLKYVNIKYDYDYLYIAAVGAQMWALVCPPSCLIGRFGGVSPYDEDPWPTPLTHHALFHCGISEMAPTSIFLLHFTVIIRC